MSFDDHLIHTCTIENRLESATNVYRNAIKAYGTPIENVRCRLIETRETVESDETTEGAIGSVYLLMIRSDANLLEKAKISKITLEDGVEINDVFEVAFVLQRRGRNAHHKTATLERIS